MGLLSFIEVGAVKGRLARFVTPVTPPTGCDLRNYVLSYRNRVTLKHGVSAPEGKPSL